MREHAGNFLHARGQIDGLEHLLLLFRRHVHEGCDEVGKRRRRRDALDRGRKLGRGLRQQRDRLRRLPPQMDEARLDLGRARLRLRDAQDAGDEERPAVEEFRDLEALVALAHEMVRAVRRGDVAHDTRHRPHAVHVDGGGISNIGGPLHQDSDLPLLAHRLLCRRNRARTSERDRQHQVREQHEAADRNDDQRVRRQRRKRRGGRSRAFLARVAQLRVSQERLRISAT